MNAAPYATATATVPSREHEPAYRETPPLPPLPFVGGGLRHALTFVSIALIALGLAYIGAFVLMFVEMDHGPHSTAAFSSIMTVACGLFVTFLVHVALIAAWAGKTWAWLPAHLRRSKLWPSEISPALAGGLFLVPYFNLFWMFVIMGGLCDALEKLRVEHAPIPSAVPHRLGLGASIATLVILFGFPLPGAYAIPWILFTRRIETVMNEFART